MKKTFEQLVREAQQIRLTEHEKSRIREVLFDFARMHPRPHMSQRHAAEEQKPSSWFSISAISVMRHMHYMPLFLLIGILASGSIAVGAEMSLPGDTLYPVKVNVTEEVRGWFEVSSEERAEWEARRAERRLEEAVQLASKGEIDADVRARIESNFKIHSDRVENEIAKLEQANDADAAAKISSEFETALRAHGSVLSQLVGSQANIESADAFVSADINPILVTVHSTIDSVGKARKNAEAKISEGTETQAKVAAEKKLKVAENRLSEVRKFVERRKANLGAEATENAEAELEAADKVMADGKAKLVAGSYGDAFALFQKSIRLAQESKLLFEARKDLQVEVALKHRIVAEEDNEDASSTTAAARAENDGSNEGESEEESALGITIEGTASTSTETSSSTPSGTTTKDSKEPLRIDIGL